MVNGLKAPTQMQVISNLISMEVYFVWKKMLCDDDVSVVSMVKYEMTHSVFGV